MSVIDDLISHIIELKYNDLPDQVIEVAKRSVLDTLASAIAGSSAEGLKQMVNLARAWGGREESTILVYGGRVPAPVAALVNSTMARARDLDDVHELAGMHLGATIIPSAFVIAEYGKMFKNKPISGKDFILATAIGSDLSCRWRMAGGTMAREGAFTADVVFPIAVAAMGGKLFGFEKTRILNAMGIAYAQCSGNRQAFIEGSTAVRLQQGLSAKAGILSIVLADEGLTGAKDIIEGEYGFYSAYTRGEYVPEVLVAELGKRFEGSNVSIKPYPCCKHTHGAIYGVLQLAQEHEIKARNVQQVIISANSAAYTICGGEGKIQPQTVPDAQFSLYYTVATSLVKGKVSIEDFSEQAITNPEVLSLARKVKIVVDAEKDKLDARIAPTDVEIVTDDGKHYMKHISFVKGHPQNPMTTAECIEKLKDCARFSAEPLSSHNIDKLSETAEHLAELDDVTTILKCLG